MTETAMNAPHRSSGQPKGWKALFGVNLLALLASTWLASTAAFLAFESHRNPDIAWVVVLASLFVGLPVAVAEAAVLLPLTIACVALWRRRHPNTWCVGVLAPIVAAMLVLALPPLLHFQHGMHWTMLWQWWGLEILLATGLLVLLWRTFFSQAVRGKECVTANGETTAVSQTPHPAWQVFFGVNRFVLVVGLLIGSVAVICCYMNVAPQGGDRLQTSMGLAYPVWLLAGLPLAAVEFFVLGPLTVLYVAYWGRRHPRRLRLQYLVVILAAFGSLVLGYMATVGLSMAGSWF